MDVPPQEQQVGDPAAGLTSCGFPKGRPGRHRKGAEQADEQQQALLGRSPEAQWETSRSALKVLLGRQSALYAGPLPQRPGGRRVGAVAPDHRAGPRARGVAPARGAEAFRRAGIALPGLWTYPIQISCWPGKRPSGPKVGTSCAAVALTGLKDGPRAGRLDAGQSGPVAPSMSASRACQHLIRTD